MSMLCSGLFSTSDLFKQELSVIHGVVAILVFDDLGLLLLLLLVVIEISAMQSF